MSEYFDFSSTCHLCYIFLRSSPIYTPNIRQEKKKKKRVYTPKTGSEDKKYRRETHHQNVSIKSILSSSPLPSWRPVLIHAHLDMLEDANRVDQPVSILKRRGVSVDVVIASIRQRAALRSPDITGPVAAKGRIKDNVVVDKVRAKVTGIALEQGQRGAPRRGIGRVGQDIGGRVGVREEPDVNAVAGPLHGVDAAVDVVEAGAEAVGGGGGDAAARRAVTGVVAVGFDEGAAGRGARVLYAAAGRGVQRDLVRRCSVDVFDNVNLAGAGPGRVIAEGPPGWPNTTGRTGHVINIGDE